MPAENALDVVIRGTNVLVDGEPTAQEIGIADGKIVRIEPLGTELSAAQYIDLASDEVLIPGLVDTHVHINEPGRTDWEGFASATRAAAAGGVTTVIDMPLNSIPSTVNVPALEIKREVAAPQAFVDVGFWAGAVPGNMADLRPLHEAGVFGFKCFLLDSGVEEFQPLAEEELAEDLRELASFGSLMIVHAEDAESIASAPERSSREYADFLNSRPAQAENIAIERVIEATRATAARSHILHLSSAQALPLIRAAKDDDVDITAETCPHYLTLFAEDIPDGATAFKCCPPVREESNRDALWEGLIDGTIDYIVSDHSPATAELKEPADGDFSVAWGGVSSLQLGLSLIWTEARDRGIGLGRVIEWMSDKPAQRAGLNAKGKIAVGYDADLAIFAPDETWTIDAGDLFHKNAVTPYQSKEVRGKVRRTILRGETVDYAQPHGELLTKD